MNEIAKDILFEIGEIAEEIDYKFSPEELDKLEKWSREERTPIPKTLRIYINGKKKDESESDIRKKISGCEGYPNIDKFFEKDGQGAFSEHKTAEYLRKHLNFVTFRDTEELYVFKRGRYIPKGETYVKEAVEKILQYRYRDQFSSRTISKVKHSTYINREKNEEIDNLINCSNCLIDISDSQNIEIKEHNPRQPIITQIPAEFDPTATCPKFEQFLDDIVENFEDRMKIQEMFGHALMPNYKYQKAFLLYGEGSNGKSVLLNTLRKLLGKENTSSVELHELDERYKASDLHGKLANICSDISSDSLQQTDQFKKLTGDDELTVRKIYEGTFSFQNYASLIFSGNEIPRTSDKTDAFYRRWVIIKFPYKFTDDPNDGHKMRNENIIAEITTQEELSGILNFALRGLRRLKRNGKFYNQRRTEEIRNLYERASNPTAFFVNQKVKPDPNGRYTKDSLYREFQNFCHQHGLTPESKQDFLNQLYNISPAKSNRRMINGERKRVVEGILV